MDAPRQQYSWLDVRRWATELDPIQRYLRCPVCRLRISTPRRGPQGNALGATARLRGYLWQHLREAHPDEVAL